MTLKQLTNINECAGRTITKAFCDDLCCLFFSDGTFLVLNTEYESSLIDVSIKSTLSEKLRLGIINQEEANALEAEEKEQRRKEYRAIRRKELEQLKSEFREEENDLVKRTVATRLAILDRAREEGALYGLTIADKNHLSWERVYPHEESGVWEYLLKDGVRIGAIEVVRNDWVFEVKFVPGTFKP